MSTTIITREIGIDAGHRVPDHRSKCKSPHGHRYRVQLEVSGLVQGSGAENGMVKDFSILKQVMMEYIDEPFDHAFIISQYDKMMLQAYGYKNIQDDFGKNRVLPSDLQLFVARKERDPVYGRHIYQAPVKDHTNSVVSSAQWLGMIVPKFEAAYCFPYNESSEIPPSITGKHVVIDRSPTAENLAMIWGCLCNQALQAIDKGLKVESLTVWETPNCSAIWRS